MYTVFELLQAGVAPSEIAIIANHLPGDQSIEYASPYAGAYYTPLSLDKLFKHARYTYQNLHRLQKFLGPRCGIARAPCTEHIAEPLSPEELANLRFIPDLVQRKLEKPGFSHVVTFDSYVFNPPRLTGTMMAKFRQLGVSVERRKLKSIDEALAVAPTVFNCSGLGAAQLLGDGKVYSTRGQVLVVHAPHIQKVETAWNDEATYVIARPELGGEVILGGFYQEHRYDANTYAEEAEDILKRVTALVPELLLRNPRGPELSDLHVLRTVAGARPTREGGNRLERENIGSGVVVHNYGACGQGYLSGLGLAHYSLELALGGKTKL